MSNTKDLFLAILSLDAYNRGYGAGIGLGSNDQVGIASVNARDDMGVSPEEYLAWQDASFLAGAYTIGSNRPDGTGGSGIEGLDVNSTVISYRGTDVIATELFGTDIPLSIFGQWRDPQLAMASRFFQSVDENTTGSIHLTGHSLGGALAGLKLSVSNDREPPVWRAAA